MRRTIYRRAAIAAAAAAVTATALAAQPAAATTAAHPVANRGANSGAHVTVGRLVELNHSGVRGVVILVERAGQLRAILAATGLEPQQMHMSHIHGFGNGTQAHCPDMSLAGPDGVLSFADGLPAYGPVLLTFGHDVPRHSVVAFSRKFTTTDAGDPVASLGALNQYVIVVHGLTNAGTFDPSLPVACAVLTTLGR